MSEKTYPIQPHGKGPRRAKMPTQRAQRWLADGEKANGTGLQVFVTQTAYKRICDHAASDLDNEVGGWLAGRWCRDPETKTEFVVVEALLPAQQVRSGSTFLTFTHDSQVAMLSALEERYAKKGVVGWYHTHPRMGIFLSGYDTWLHNHFFPHPWQVALVVEPHSGMGGFFIRDKDNKLDARKYFGFYELHNRRKESVMAWKNLRLEKKKEIVAEAPQEQKPGEVASAISSATNEAQEVAARRKQLLRTSAQTQEASANKATEIAVNAELENKKTSEVSTATKFVHVNQEQAEKPSVTVHMKKTEAKVAEKKISIKPPAKKTESSNEPEKEIKSSEEAKP